MDPVADKVSAAAPISPIEVTMIGTGTGDGGAPVTTGTIGVTADHMPNIVVQVVQPIFAILIRFVNVYLGMIIGLLTGGPMTGILTAPDFGHLLVKCASLALGGAVVLMFKDVVTVFSGLERKFPLATGSI